MSALPPPPLQIYLWQEASHCLVARRLLVVHSQLPARPAIRTSQGNVQDILAKTDACMSWLWFICACVFVYVSVPQEWSTMLVYGECLSVCTCLSVCPNVCVCIPVCLCVCVSLIVCKCICVCVLMFVFMSLCVQSFCVCLCMPTCLCVCLCVSKCPLEAVRQRARGKCVVVVGEWRRLRLCLQRQRPLLPRACCFTEASQRQ